MPTGTPPGATGSGDRSTSIQPTESQPPAPWASILNETLTHSDKRLVHKLAHALPEKLASLDFASLEAKRARLDYIVEAIDAAREPATPETIMKTLGVVAEVLQVSLPSAPALKVYANVLADIPGPALAQAATVVLSTHDYNTMPAPAKFRKAADQHTRYLASIRSLAVNCATKIKMAIEKREKDHGRNN